MIILGDAGPRPAWARGRTGAFSCRAAGCGRASVERAETHAERWSDHAPVTAVFDIGND
ncbi:hypothetical protein [Kitasatospora sp. NPDC094011]|uniref:hypothetical protein n=1 Tax=Kitasatospora sp. NPDC094011 TaxID=3364090 RepID=UPI003826F923